MNLEQKAAMEAEEACDRMVKEQLKKGWWVSSREWIAMREAERVKNLTEDQILASFW